MKLLLVIVVIVVLVLAWRARARAGQRESPAPTEKPVDDMVACAYCGVYQPRQESRCVGTRYYCSEAHQQAESARE